LVVAWTVTAVADFTALRLPLSCGLARRPFVQLEQPHRPGCQLQQISAAHVGRDGHVRVAAVS
jgi:hypothetical protein